MTTAFVGPGTGPDVPRGDGTTGIAGGAGGNGRGGFSLDGVGLAMGSLAVPRPIFVWLGTTIGGLLLFLFLVRRRRRDDAPSLATFVLEGAAPVAPQTVPTPPGVSLPPPPTASPPAKPEEPRKRSRGKRTLPAVASAGGGTASTVVASSFAKPPAKGVERVFVTYRGVPMTAAPDQIRPMVARLERGNEIEIIGSHEGYLNVRTPSGLTGWIPRVTVSDVRPPAPGGSAPAQN